MPTAIHTDKITKTFGHRRALDKVSFDLPQGAFLAIFGPNGAGKTTLLRTLVTLSPATSGKAQVLGYDLKEEPEEIRARIGLIGHESMLYGDLTAEENLLFFARMYGVKDPQERSLELLRAVGLDHRRLDLVRTFSRGMTQRLSIARALLPDPQVLFLDEPYSGLDPHAMDILDGLIADIRQDRTFVMVSHDLEKGFALCTHTLMLAKGRVVLFDDKNAIAFDDFHDLYRTTVGMGVS